MINSELLEDLIKSSGKSKTYLANKCGMSRSEFYLKSKGKREFTEGQATILCDELNITTMSDRRKIFLP